MGASAKTFPLLSVPTLLIRIPMLSDVQNVIRYADYSLESEISVLEALNEDPEASPEPGTAL